MKYQKTYIIIILQNHTSCAIKHVELAKKEVVLLKTIVNHVQTIIFLNQKIELQIVWNLVNINIIMIL